MQRKKGIYLPEMATVGLIANVDKGLAIYFQRFDKQYTGNFANWVDEYGIQYIIFAGLE